MAQKRTSVPIKCTTGSLQRSYGRLILKGTDKESCSEQPSVCARVYACVCAHVCVSICTHTCASTLTPPNRNRLFRLSGV